MRKRREDTPTEVGELVRFGTIAEVDLASGYCTVDTGDVRSGNIRWIESRAGATRTWSPPSIGEQVLLVCADGELGAGVAFRGISSDVHPPAGDTLRELISFADSAVLAYDPEAHVLDVTLPEGATINIIANGGITVKGDIRVEGDVIASDVSLVHHVHGDSMPGDGETGKPVAEAVPA